MKKSSEMARGHKQSVPKYLQAEVQHISQNHVCSVQRSGLVHDVHLRVHMSTEFWSSCNVAVEVRDGRSWNGLLLYDPDNQGAVLFHWRWYKRAYSNRLGESGVALNWTVVCPAVRNFVSKLMLQNWPKFLVLLPPTSGLCELSLEYQILFRRHRDSTIRGPYQKRPIEYSQVLLDCFDENFGSVVAICMFPSITWDHACLL